MRAPTPAQLLQVWERGCDRPGAARALLLLAAANDGADTDDLAALPLGRRDALLIELHARLFHERIVGLARCPQCGVEVEAAFECEDLLAVGASAPSAASPTDTALTIRSIAEATHTLEADGATLRFRLPDSRDMLALHDLMREELDTDSMRAAERARDLLLARCLLTVERDGQALPVESLSDSQRDALSMAMAAADPLADLRLGFVCPGCTAAWDAGFDPVNFVWQQLQVWALRTLREVDLIARVYHWREADILALSPRRRRAYLELCGS